MNSNNNDNSIKLVQNEILDCTPIGICIIRKDFTVIFWNRCMQEWTGIKKEDIEQKKLIEIYPHFNNSQYKMRLESLFSGGVPIVFSSQLHKHIFPAKLSTGELRIQHTTVSPVPIENSNEFCAQFSVEDVTELTHRLENIKTIRDKLIKENAERKKTQLELKDSEEMYRVLFNNAGSPISYYSLDGTLLLVNQISADNLGRSPEELIGKSIYDVIPEFTKEALEMIREKIETGKGLTIEKTLKLPKGERHYILNFYPVKDALGNIFAAQLVSQDITKRKIAELELKDAIIEVERSNTELTQFAYVASHDLKAPLRAIDNLTTWIEEDIQSVMTDETKNNMRLMRSRVARMGSLLDSLLEYSRVGRIEGQMVMVDTKKMIEDVVELIIPPRGFNVIVSDEMPIFKTLNVPLELVFRNLISNSIKYHKSTNGYVEISVEDAGNYFAFSVKDDGAGIAEKFHKKIFVMFQRLHSGDDIEGTGMGLALVKKTIENYGGVINVKSHEGEGALFEFTWPKIINDENV